MQNVQYLLGFSFNLFKKKGWKKFALLLQPGKIKDLIKNRG